TPGALSRPGRLRGRIGAAPAGEGRLRTFWHGQGDGQELAFTKLFNSFNRIWRTLPPPRRDTHRFSGATDPAVLAVCAVLSTRTYGVHGGHLACFYSLTGLFSPKLCTTAIWYKAPQVRI